MGACTCMNGGGAERERETQNLKQAPGSELSAQSLMWRLNSQTMRSKPELKSQMLNLLSHPGAPRKAHSKRYQTRTSR